MKTVVDGIYYDTAIAQLLSANCISLHGIAAEETAYCMPDGHHFIVRRINGQETALLPATAEDILCWEQYRKKFPSQLWPK